MNSKIVLGCRCAASLSKWISTRSDTWSSRMSTSGLTTHAGQPSGSCIATATLKLVASRSLSTRNVKRDVGVRCDCRRRLELDVGKHAGRRQ